jgi:hypothetical protein
VDSDQARVKDGLPVEAHITAGLNHVNVVHTIAHAWRPLSAHVNAGLCVWDSAGSTLSPSGCASGEGETWLLLELCDRGTLQVLRHTPLACSWQLPLRMRQVQPCMHCHADAAAARGASWPAKHAVCC